MRIFVRFVEGMRGLAALYVMLAHMYGYAIDAHIALVPPLFVLATHWLNFGPVGVCVFIVISGYCLMIPNVESFDVGRFFYKRARRILPPYYGAIVISAVLFIAWERLTHEPARLSHVAAAAALHAALVHNLISQRVSSSLNGAMWSIALECQIYVVFALLLIPLVRRIGLLATVAVALILGVIPHYALHGRWDWTQPWLLGAFALGMGAAVLGRSSATRTRSYIATCALTGALGVLLLSRLPRHYDGAALLLPDLLIAISVAAFIAAGTRHQRYGGTWPILRFLQCRPVFALGAFSYSLYLLHLPIVRVLDVLLDRLAPLPQMTLYVCVAAPLIIAFAWCFYLVLERPFISRFRTTEESTALPVSVAASEQSALGRVS
jgi:peptidoglycan/LPS O-acetylase OafA/YrhL